MFNADDQKKWSLMTASKSYVFELLHTQLLLLPMSSRW